MSFIAACPHCQAKFAAQDYLVGKNVRCPKCKVPFRIDDVVVQAQKKAQAERDKTRKIKEELEDDLPVARPAKPPAKSGSAKSGSSSPAPAKSSKPPTRSWKELADNEKPPEPKAAAPAPSAAKAESPPASPPPPKRRAQPTPPASVASPPAPAPPEQPIVISAAVTAAWEALPPLILASAHHHVASLPTAPQPQAAQPSVDAAGVVMPAWDDDLDDSMLDHPPSDADLPGRGKSPRPSTPAAARQSASPTPKPAAEEVIELGFDDLVIERMEEEAVELSDGDFLDEPASSSPTPKAAKSLVEDLPSEVVSDVDVIEEAPNSMSSNLGSSGANLTTLLASLQTLDLKNPQVKLLAYGGGGALAIVVLLIAALMLSGDREFEPSSSFTPTSGAITKFVDPSGRISVRFPQPYADVPTAQRNGVVVRGAQLVGKSETFGIYYTDSIPVIAPPAGAKPIAEHWKALDLPEMYSPFSPVVAIRRHMMGNDYAVEYQLATDIQRDQPGETRVLLVFIQQRMFLLIWSGEVYRGEVDDFFNSFTIGDLNFGELAKQ